MIDWDRVKAEMVVRAGAGLRATAEFTLARARHHAPVRAAFKRSRRGRAFTSQGPITTKAAYQAFMRSKERRIRVDIQSAPRGAGRFVQFASDEQTGGRVRPGSTSPILRAGGGQVSRTVIPGERIAPTIGREAKRFGRSTSFSGHANTLVPVLTSKSGFRITGDLRRLGPVGVGVQQHRMRPDPVEVVAPRALEQVRAAGLSGRGRYEVRQATLGIARQGRSPSGKRFALVAAFNGRIGGRLRGEIMIVPPRMIGHTLWIWVRSPTPYAEWQEFGTSRHRAQPFLRPALYESRKILRSEVTKSVATIRGASSGVTPGVPGPGVD